MDIKIIVENGERLIEADVEAYYELQDKIKSLVKETFPGVRYCDVEVWGPGYYQGDQIRKALAGALSEKVVIDKIAAVVRNVPAGV